MATFVISFIKKSPKGNYVASFTKKGQGKLQARPLLWRAWCDATAVVGEEFEIADSEFVADTFVGDDGNEKTIHWYNPA